MALPTKVQKYLAVFSTNQATYHNESARIGPEMPEEKYKPPYAFSVTIGETCNRKMRNFVDLAEKLRMPVEDLMRHRAGYQRELSG
jgi:hypothetical protein